MSTSRFAAAVLSAGALVLAACQPAQQAAPTSPPPQPLPPLLSLLPLPRPLRLPPRMYVDSLTSQSAPFVRMGPERGAPPGPT